MHPELDSVFSAVPQALQTISLSPLREKLKENCDAEQLQWLANHLQGERAEQFARMLWASLFAAEQLCEDPTWLLDLVAGDGLDQPWGKAQYQGWFSTAGIDSDEDFDRRLRQQRNRAMTRIIWRDFNRLASTLGTTEELTYMAEAVLQQTLNYHYPKLCDELGTPTSPGGRAQPFLILGMGKLGAWELNLSSDIDLIFVFPDGGDTTGARRSVSNQEFFTKLGQRLIKSIDQVNAEGFVFRVDMRLRPYGQSGALVSSFNALEDYYQTQGREWERFAMIKARVVAHNGSQADVNTLMQLLRSFTYRRYVDFTAIDALRNLKQLINREIRKRRIADNVKLGRGGIREVEFIAQAFQIIRGGRDTQLQDRRVLNVLPILEQLHCLPAGTAESLHRAYCFLRDVEHAIQGFQDRQTQELPRDPKHQLRLAMVMGFADWPSFYDQLNQHRELVHKQFSAVIANADDDNDNDSHAALTQWRSIWSELTNGSVDDDAPADLEPIISTLKQDLLPHPSVVAMSSMSRERFDEFMPRLLALLSEQDEVQSTLTRLIPLIHAVARRSAYLLLLSENPAALQQLITLTQASPWISAQLAKNPALLDELLDPTSLYSVPDRQELTQELRQQTLRLEQNDLEAQMETLRYFRLSHALRVAACEVTGRLPLMKVSDYLTELAEAILAYVMQLAWHEVTNKHGYPSGIVAEHPEFLIVGYGKLGGIELGHGSDLDLVFIHDADPLGSTSGPVEGLRSLDNLTFYMRLGQKIIHILNARTPSGQLYEVDMRLRPSGNSGLLVSTFNAFEKYQNDAAWTWEHQALVRARAICGSDELAERFNRLRQDTLSRDRDLPALATEVVNMRQKMRDQLGSNKKQQGEGLFNLKQDAGGIVDIEFMVQYAVLAWSNTHPALTEYTDNIRILERLATTGQLSTQEVQQLIEAYKALRSIGHRLALQQQPNLVNTSEVEPYSETVQQIWQRLLTSQIEGASP